MGFKNVKHRILDKTIWHADANPVPDAAGRLLQQFYDGIWPFANAPFQDNFDTMIGADWLNQITYCPDWDYWDKKTSWPIGDDK